MTGEQMRLSTRYFYNSSTSFDGSNIHDISMNSAAGLLSGPSADQFFYESLNSDRENGQVSASLHGHPGGLVALNAGTADDTTPDLNILSSAFDGAAVPATELAAAAADVVLNHGAASLFSTDDAAFIFTAEDHDSGSMRSDAKLSLDVPQYHSLNVSLDVVGWGSSGQTFSPGATGSLDAPVSVTAIFMVPEFDRGGALPGAAPDFGGDITPIDADFFAKGGGSGPGGGGGGGGSGGVLTQYFSGSGNGTAGYDIWIGFKGSGWTTGLQDAFVSAANYFTTVITDDIGGGGIYRGKVIDDLYVSAELKAIDGTGGILGQAGPTAVWTSNDLTAAGQMQFDVADATNYLGQGLWDDIVTHEMTHVLGFGSLWNYGSHSLVSNYQYTGQYALDAYKAAVDATATFIPVENDGGSGTAGSHWDEQALTNELMTGYINNDGNPATVGDNYLSKFSVMSLADLGYHVGYQDYQYDGILLV